jgi:hypothetical protein
MGKTQGMTFRIRPPRKAKRKVSGRWEVEVEGDCKATEIVRARCPEVSQGFSATRSPERVLGILVFGLSGTLMTSRLPVFSVFAGWNSST